MPQTPVNRPTLTSLDELDAVQIGEIEHFFAAYNAVQGRTFKITGRIGAKGAERLLTQAIRRFRA